jgi:hypothetical protein
MKTVRGEWRVIGRSTDDRELLVRPVGEGPALPDDLGLAGCLRVGTDQYGDERDDIVAGLSVGALIDAGVYPGAPSRGTPGRFVELTTIEAPTLTLVHETDRTPSVAVDLWERATTEEDAREPVGASLVVETGDGDAEVHVLRSSLRGPDDVWWQFVAGDGGESPLSGFEHLDGKPADVVAANPTTQPFFYVFAFPTADTAAAGSLRETLGVTDAGGARRPLSVADIERLVREHGMTATVHAADR